VITRSVTPLSNPQRDADCLVRSAHAGTYARSPRPYPTFGADRSVSPISPRDGGSDLSPDFLPEMADCRGW
jgi:hypothetical protein